MKTAYVQKRFMDRPYIAYPNAATRRELMNRILDKILIGACCLGACTAILFLLSQC